MEKKQSQRRKEEIAALYDYLNDQTIQDPNCFTLWMHHGGHFVYHPSVKYVGGSVQTWPNIDKDKVSLVEFDSFYNDLGYSDYSTYYYTFTPSNLAEGLELLSTDVACVRMTERLEENNMVVDVYCKHSEEYQGLRRNDNDEGDKSSGYSGSAYGESDLEVNDRDWTLPSALNNNEETNVRENVCEPVGGDANNVDEFTSMLGLNFDELLEFDENEELTVSNRKKRGKYRKREASIIIENEWDIRSDVDDDSDDFKSLNGSEEEYEENDLRYQMGRKKFPNFRKFKASTDMEKPVFEIGQEFTDFKEFRLAVKSYTAKVKKGIWFDKNERMKVSAKYKEGCPWYIYGSQNKNGDNVFRVRTFINKHTCSNVIKNTCINSTFIGHKYSDRCALNPTWPVNSFFHTVNKELELSVSRSSAYRALQLAKKKAAQSVEELYKAIFDYKKELLRSNSGTTVDIQCKHENGKPVLERIYVYLGGLKKGFKEGCRSVIGLDGCFLKGSIQGMILAAVGIDANNGMWPFAYAVVESENKASWTWFLELLLEDIGCVNSFHWTFISDKQKGLVPSLKALVPDAEIRFCVKHLHDNFKLKYRGSELKVMLYACAKASYVQKFNVEMEKLKNKDEDAYNWLASKTPSEWSRAFFDTKHSCDMLLNNLCETFNGCILKARSKPILDLLEWIRLYMMTRLQKNREKMRKNPGLICPRVQEKLEKYKSDSHGYIDVWSAVLRYQIRGMYGDQFDVDLNTRECSRRKWQLTGIPCPHAICALNHNEFEVELYVADCYRKETYLKAYDNVIYPIRGQDMWPKTGAFAYPPTLVKKKGRVRVRRIRQLDEGKTNSHKLRKYQDTVKCICSQEYHNARTCPNRPPPQRAQ